MNNVIRSAWLCFVLTGAPILCEAQAAKTPVPSMNFAYEISRHSEKYGPSAVYDDGKATFLQLRAETLPRVVTVGGVESDVSVTREGLLLKLDAVLDAFRVVFTDATVEVRRLSPTPSKLPGATTAPAVVERVQPAAATTPLAPLAEAQVGGSAPPVAVAQPVVPTLKVTESVNWVRFEARADQRLSEALRHALAQSVWEDIVWDTHDDFVLSHGFTLTAADFPELFRVVLAPFGLSARFHRGNHLVQVFSSVSQ